MLDAIFKKVYLKAFCKITIKKPIVKLQIAFFYILNKKKS